MLGCWSAASMRTVTSRCNESCIPRIIICLLVFPWALSFELCEFWAASPACITRAAVRCIVNHDEDGARIADDGTKEGRHHSRHHPRDYSARVRDAAPGKCKKRASVHCLLVLHKLADVVAEAQCPSACLRPFEAAHLSHRGASRSLMDPARAASKQTPPTAADTGTGARGDSGRCLPSAPFWLSWTCSTRTRRAERQP